MTEITVSAEEARAFFMDNLQDAVVRISVTIKGKYEIITGYLENDGSLPTIRVNAKQVHLFDDRNQYHSMKVTRDPQQTRSRSRGRLDTGTAPLGGNSDTNDTGAPHRDGTGGAHAAAHNATPVVNNTPPVAQNVPPVVQNASATATSNDALSRTQATLDRAMDLLVAQEENRSRRADGGINAATFHTLSNIFHGNGQRETWRLAGELVLFMSLELMWLIFCPAHLLYKRNDDEALVLANPVHRYHEAMSTVRRKFPGQNNIPPNAAQVLEAEEARWVEDLEELHERASAGNPPATKAQWRRYFLGGAALMAQFATTGSYYQAGALQIRLEFDKQWINGKIDWPAIWAKSADQVKVDLAKTSKADKPGFRRE